MSTLEGVVVAITHRVVDPLLPDLRGQLQYMWVSSVSPLQVSPGDHPASTLDTYTPVEGNRVLVARVEGGFCVIGKVA